MKCKRPGCPNEEQVRSQQGMGYCSAECAPLLGYGSQADLKRMGKTIAMQERGVALKIPPMPNRDYAAVTGGPS